MRSSLIFGRMLYLGGVLVFSAVWATGFMTVARAQTQSSAQTQSEGPSQSANTTLQDAYDRAFKAMFADPGDMDKSFAFAQLAARKGDFEGAIATLERMLLIDPDLPRVKLELGVLYFRLQSYGAATTYFSELASTPDVPKTVLERVARYTAEIEKRTSAHKLSATVYAGLRYQSNANAGPSSSRVRVLDLDADLDDAFTEKDDTDGFASLRLSHVYDFGREPNLQLETDLVLYGVEQATQDQLDTQLAQLTIGPRIDVDPDVALGLELKPYARFEYIALGDRKYLSSYGAGLQAKYPWADAITLSANGSVTNRQYNNTPRAPSASNFDGLRSRLSLGLARELGNRTQADAFIGVLRENTKTGGSTNWEYHASASLRHAIPSPISVLPGSWVFSLSLSGDFARYDAPDPSVDSSITRRDDKWRLNALASIPLANNVALITSAGYADIQSNLANYTYDNWSVSLGVVAQF